MKLRFRQNSLRLRVNQREVDTLAAGEPIREDVLFPNDAWLTNIFEPFAAAQPQASFEHGEIRVAAPLWDVQHWALGTSIGLYFEVPAESTTLKVAIEKDLECVDGPPEESDPYAFPRKHNGC